MKLTLKVRWNPSLERWVILDAIGKNVLEVPDCYNVYRLTDGELEHNCFHTIELSAKVMHKEPLRKPSEENNGNIPS